MSRIVYAHQGDTVDAICQRIHGKTAGVTEQVLELNPGLAEFGPILPQGTPVAMPELARRQERTDTVQLWS
ncbi:tail protein X [Salinicola rhizosphaerae]|uniref:Tail protein X n=1 Tax=Salinicola rhizosphaerae TaxID=1443141 RepID=A0ABQ3EFZ6_9GAMM|nr:tail protein X [Salinicola rhizosphaerae]GHB32841.1 tail protein X [Salinicola rhizosphaerae]